jgi:hypothetical protein
MIYKVDPFHLIPYDYPVVTGRVSSELESIPGLNTGTPSREGGAGQRVVGCCNENSIWPGTMETKSEG